MRVLIVGIDSGIGGRLADALTASGAAVYGTTRRADAQLNDRLIGLDLDAPDAADAHLPSVDATVFCAAIARFAECREQPERARRVDVEVPVALAQRLVAAGSRVVLLSTSAVFDGRSPGRKPLDATSPISAYGRLKAEAEAGFLALGSAASVLRLTKVVTPRMQPLADWVVALAERRTVRAFRDLRFCPIPIDEVVEALLAVIDDAAGGIYQVSGAADISYSEAAHHLARRAGAPAGLVTEARAADYGIPAEEILAHTSLDTERLTTLTGFRPPDPFSVLDSAFAAVRAPQLRATG